MQTEMCGKLEGVCSPNRRSDYGREKPTCRWRPEQPSRAASNPLCSANVFHFRLSSKHCSLIQTRSNPFYKSSVHQNMRRKLKACVESIYFTNKNPNHNYWTSFCASFFFFTFIHKQLHMNVCTYCMIQCISGK